MIMQNSSVIPNKLGMFPNSNNSHYASSVVQCFSSCESHTLLEQFGAEYEAEYTLICDLSCDEAQWDSN